MKLFLRLPPALRDALQRYLERPAFARVPQTEAESHDSLLHEKSSTRPSSTWQRLLSVLARRPLFAGLFVTTLLIVCALALLSVHTRILGPHLIHDPQFFYILIPTSAPTANLCKSVLSAQILNYPNPWLINWESELDKPGMENERDLARIHLISQFLSALSESSQEGTALLLDGPTAWFQLRPEVMLKRYFEINRRANKALASRIGKSAMLEEGVEQTVVFAAQRTCQVGFEENDLACYAVPPSPGQEGSRYLNIGAAIGPVKHLRAIYEEVAKRATESNANIQNIMAEIYGEQEFQREVIRQRHWSWVRHAWHSFATPFGNDITILDPVLGRKRTDYLEGSPSEFHIGIDHGSEIGFSTVDGVDAMKWQQHSAGRLAPDVAESMPPFWTTGDETLPVTATWGDVDLLTNTNTDTTPALIHHNMNDVNERWWKNMWFQHYARELLTDTISLPASIVANFVDQTAGVERSFWHPKTTNSRVGVRSGDGKWIEWSGLCGSEEKARELFLDDKGPWKGSSH